MSLESYCVNIDEDGTELRLISPLNKTSVVVNEMLGTPWGKSLWAARSLAVNPSYDSSSSSSSASASAAAGGGGKEHHGISSSGTIGNMSFSGAMMASASNSGMKVDRIGATPDCSLLAVASERVLRLVSSDSKSVVAEMWMEEKILNIRCNTQIIAVILAKATHFFHIETLQPLPELRTQWPNSNNNGLGALSPMLGLSCFFAVSQSLSDKKERGDIFLYNPVEAATLTVIDAHDEPVRCLEFCGTGARFASCSNNGRRIRIWSCPECIPLYELQRGSSDAIIFSMAMNFEGTLLALTSNSGTLHIFQPAKNTRSVSKITTRSTHNMCFLSPDGGFMFVLYPPDAQSKTSKLERYKLSNDCKAELENEMNLAV